MRGHVEEHERGVVVRPSLWAMLEAFGKWLLALVGILLALAIPAVLQGLQDEGPWYLALIENFQLGISAIIPLIPAVRVAFTTYSFDERGLRVRSRVLATQDHRIGWDKVTALRQRRTLIDRMVGTTRLEVIAYGVRGATLRLVGVRDGAAVRDLVAQAMRRHCTVAALQDSD